MWPSRHARVNQTTRFTDLMPMFSDRWNAGVKATCLCHRQHSRGDEPDGKRRAEVLLAPRDPQTCSDVSADRSRSEIRRRAQISIAPQFSKAHKVRDTVSMVSPR